MAGILPLYNSNSSEIVYNIGGCAALTVLAIWDDVFLPESSAISDKSSYGVLYLPILSLIVKANSSTKLILKYIYRSF